MLFSSTKIKQDVTFHCYYVDDGGRTKPPQDKTPSDKTPSD